MEFEIITFCVNFSAICLAGTYLAKITKPIRQAMDELEEEKRETQEVKEKLFRDKKHIDQLKQENRLQFKILLDIADHMITGNHVERLKETKKEIVSYLTEVKDNES